MSTSLRALREAAGLTQAELSRRSRVAQPNIAAYETGRRTPSAAMVQRLRRAARPLPHESLAAHRDELLQLAAEFGLSDLRVFGSARRGTDGPSSDLDLLVTRSPGTGLLTLGAFADAASALLGVEVDVVTDGSLRPDHEILTSAVPA